METSTLTRKEQLGKGHLNTKVALTIYHNSIQRHVYLSAMVILPTALSSFSELTTAGRVLRVFSMITPSKSSPRPTKKICPKSHYTVTY